MVLDVFNLMNLTSLLIVRDVFNFDKISAKDQTYNIILSILLM